VSVKEKGPRKVSDERRTICLETLPPNIVQPLTALDVIIKARHSVRAFSSILPSQAGFTPLENPVVQAMAKTMEKVVGRAEFLQGTMSTGAYYFLQAGIPCVFFGPGSILNAHKPNEYVDLPRIEEATKIYLLTALNFLGAKD
jgi:acetylornithine deacetylase/succinyl-diaminopimelate desuccinylase-like protein